jgi:hypothetical protein
MPGVAHEIVAIPGFCMFKALFSGDKPRAEQFDIFGINTERLMKMI